MNFNLGVTKGAKEASSVLNAGIHNATFKGITKDTINGKDGSVYDVMTLTLDIEGYGEYKHNFFEPTSSERSEGMYGPNPSQQEHFLIAVRQILDAVAPSVSEGIDNGTIKIGGTFTNLVNGIKKHTDEYIGVNVQVKILPGKDGYNNIPDSQLELLSRVHLVLVPSSLVRTSLFLLRSLRVLKLQRLQLQQTWLLYSLRRQMHWIIWETILMMTIFHLEMI